MPENMVFISKRALGRQEYPFFIDLVQKKEESESLLHEQ